MIPGGMFWFYILYVVLLPWEIGNQMKLFGQISHAVIWFIRECCYMVIFSDGEVQYSAIFSLIKVNLWSIRTQEKQIASKAMHQS
jgi:hypothetical protein